MIYLLYIVYLLASLLVCTTRKEEFSFYNLSSMASIIPFS